MPTVTVNKENMHHRGNSGSMPLNREVLYSNHKSIYKKSIEKRQTKLMKKIGFIQPFLHKDEELLLITTGCSPVSLLEQLITGWIVFYLKRSLFVFTNKRIFHIPTTANYSYKTSIAQIVYADCQSIKVRGRTLTVQYKDGKKEKFLYIAGRERKKIKALLNTVSLDGEMSKSQKRSHLCPACTHELEAGKYMCSNCRLKFKNKDEAKKISLIYPGGGYFYTGHPFLGISDALAELILLVLVITSFIETLKGTAGSSVGLFMFSIILIIEKAITVYHSNHFIQEYIPLKKDIKPIPDYSRKTDHRPSFGELRSTEESDHKPASSS